MDPNSPYQNPTPAPQTPLDYLNSISTQTTQPKLLSGKLKIVVIALGSLLALLGIFLAIQAINGPNVDTQAKSLYIRITSIQAVVTSQQKHLRQNSLVSINATMSAALSSMESGISELIQSRGQDLPKTDDKALSKKDLAYKNDLISKFDDEFLKGTLDRTYASEMSYQMSLLKSQLQRFGSTKNTAAVNFANQNIPTIQVAVDKFSEFAGSK